MSIATIYNKLTIFQSTPPVKAATAAEDKGAGRRAAFQSTPPVKAATKQQKKDTRSAKISIHAAREGGDALARSCCTKKAAFQSTPPVKAAT